MPFIANLFSGAAAKVLDAVGNVVDEASTTKEEKMQLQNEIHKAELQYELEKKKMSIEEQALYLQDTASARNREVALQTNEHTNWLGRNISSYLAIAATTLCFGLFYAFVFKRDFLSNLEAGQRDIIVYILGVLSALLTQIYSYYFGSSRGSEVKEKVISDALKDKRQ